MKAPAVRETDWQVTVRDLAEAFGWLVHHEADSRRADRGLPDLVLVHPERHLVIFAELKTEKGKLRPGKWVERKGRMVYLPGQTEWVAALRACPGVACYVWRPSDWEGVKAALVPAGALLPERLA